MKSLFLLFLFINTISFGQTQKDVNTLKNNLNKSKSQEEKELLIDDYYDDFNFIEALRFFLNEKYVFCYPTLKLFSERRILHRKR